MDCSKEAAAGMPSAATAICKLKSVWKELPRALRQSVQSLAPRCPRAKMLLFERTSFFHSLSVALSPFSDAVMSLGFAFPVQNVRCAFAKSHLLSYFQAASNKMYNKPTPRDGFCAEASERLRKE
ncbi:MAG TPA: hypothetical protein IAC72_03300 [Candidatus Fimimonas merdipullorum]|uniref:Uncharacterized protein n=1 Tax=Candidatus Fimimonas merdipullorum TaxID=2840822 RepID=A0A9D1SPW0_9BACT|nr:hypothetical protein [Candidatus Fimimonas merdipullorum]